jgi:lysophospholipase L1-like esterase
MAIFVVATLVSALAMGALRQGPAKKTYVPAAAGTRPPPAYNSLGDSLAAGMQPDAQGVDRPSGQGYADIVGRRLTKAFPGLVTHLLSCGGATTRSLLAWGSSCAGRAAPSQLVQAEHWLSAHPETKLVTINIGDNDIEYCLHTSPPRIDQACIARGRQAIERNLPQIATRLRAATAKGTPVVGILDYDQFLALWRDGGASRVFARRSVAVIGSLNALMARIYRAAGVEVADASKRFSTTDLRTMRNLPGVGPVPLAVQRICLWTWACSGPPIGFDDHARTHGYAEIAQAVLDALSPH